MTNNDISNVIDNVTTRSENNDDHESSNDMSGTNGILHKPPENSACSKVPNDKNTTNPKLPPYVYRLGHSDRFACKLCNIRDDKWGMIKHYHPEGEGSSK
jgi:hypothetical protein